MVGESASSVNTISEKQDQQLGECCQRPSTGVFIVPSMARNEDTSWQLPSCLLLNLRPRPSWNLEIGITIQQCECTLEKLQSALRGTLMGGCEEHRASNV